MSYLYDDKRNVIEEQSSFRVFNIRKCYKQLGVKYNAYNTRQDEADFETKNIYKYKFDSISNWVERIDTSDNTIIVNKLSIMIILKNNIYYLVIK